MNYSSKTKKNTKIILKSKSITGKKSNIDSRSQ